MGNCKCKCFSNFKHYLESESKKRKKPPKPEEIEIQEGKQNIDGKVLTDSMRLNLSETHSEKRKNSDLMKKNNLKELDNKNNLNTQDQNVMKINQSGILFSEYKHVSQLKKNGV